MSTAEAATVSETTTTAVSRAPATTVAATTSASPLIVASFDGETCLYEGPEQVSATEMLTVGFTNESDLTAGLFVTTFRGEVLEELVSLIGQDIEPDVLGGALGISIAAELLIGPGETKTQNLLLGPGT
jgi:hypothetical protein